MNFLQVNLYRMTFEISKTLEVHIKKTLLVIVKYFQSLKHFRWRSFTVQSFNILTSSYVYRSFIKSLKSFHCIFRVLKKLFCCSLKLMWMNGRKRLESISSTDKLVTFCVLEIVSQSHFIRWVPQNYFCLVSQSNSLTIFFVVLLFSFSGHFRHLATQKVIKCWWSNISSIQ